MLDGHETYVVKHPRVGRRPIAGMEIMSDDAGREIEQALEMADGLRPATVGALVAEIAQMLAEEHVPTPDEGKHALELTAAGQNRLRGLVDQRDRHRDVAPRTAQDERSAVDASGYRVVTAQFDRPIVNQEDIRNAAQPGHGVAVLVCDGLVAAVAAGHDERTIDPLEEHVLERRVRQHQAEMVESRRYSVCKHLAAGNRCALQNHDGPSHGLKQVRLGVRDDAELPRDLEALHHQRQRLRISRLPAPEFVHHFWRGRVAGQMIATESLERDDAAGPQRGHSFLKGVARLQCPAIGVEEGKRGAARRTGDWLGMETAIADALVLRPTGSAHREGRHGRALAVVWQRPNDRVARSARSAVEEWVAATSSGGIVHFRETRRTDG